MRPLDEQIPRNEERLQRLVVKRSQTLVSGVDALPCSMADALIDAVAKQCCI